MKANLNKSLDRLKHKVADREELWLEFFQESTNALLSAYYDASEGSVADVTKLSKEIADNMLDCYEERWGKG